jgi:hypothetical protein
MNIEAGKLSNDTTREQPSFKRDLERLIRFLKEQKWLCG